MYRVGYGGGGTSAIHTTRALAESHALQMARWQAVAEGLDTSDVAIYGGPDDTRLGNRWGACVSGAEGAYWPIIWED